MAHHSVSPPGPGSGPSRPRPVHLASSGEKSAAPASRSPVSTHTSLAARYEASSGASSPASHRSSFPENLRYPPSPRAVRHPSFSGSALTELLMYPPTKNHGTDSRFVGRDWRTIQVHEIIDPAETRFVELDTSIEDTTKLLVRSGAPNVVLLRESPRTRTAVGLFGYNELNAYLLLVLGMVKPADERAASVGERARNGEVLPIKEIRPHIGPMDEPDTVPHTADLATAMVILGSGVHRLVVVKEGTSEAVGVLSQLRLVRFFWDNYQSFAVTESLYGRTLQDLGLGAKEVLSINGDRPLADALRLMHDECITSVPVLDNHSNVVGNISHVDVRLLIDTSSIPLLSNTCIHFVSVILSSRGVEDGADAWPVYHVSPTSTLAHTVAKLCATRSHRMWIVDTPSPSSSVPPSPGVVPASPVPPFTQQYTNGVSAPKLPRSSRSSSSLDIASGSPYTSTTSGVSVSAAQAPGAAMSGRLMGVVSLTDVLNLLARGSGLKPADPELTRRRRRRSSSSSSRPTLDYSARPSSEAIRSSIELGRSASQKSRR